MFHTFLIKYAEIGIKGKNRYVFEDALMQQIKNALRHCDGTFEITKTFGRIFVEAKDGADEAEVTARLQKVFGITGICPVAVLEERDITAIEDEAVRYIDALYPDKRRTFKVFARRADKRYPVPSMTINERVGARLLAAFPDLKVDVHEPEISLFIEVREKVYFYSETIPGPGGMPVGSGGKAMLLLSGGIDSPVAGYMVAKRGVKIDAVYFHAPPYTSARAKQKVIDLARILSEYAGPVYLHVINFTEIQLAIYEKCPHEELTVIMRRYMMRIAQAIAKDTECQGLITGESIGQVASQTLPALAVTNEVCDMPVFRPCIGLDKQEIVELSKKIGTFETSILPYEDCCTIFVAKHPVTKPNPEIIRRHERALDGIAEKLVQEALAADELIIVK